MSPYPGLKSPIVLSAGIPSWSWMALMSGWTSSSPSIAKVSRRQSSAPRARAARQKRSPPTAGIRPAETERGDPFRGRGSAVPYDMAGSRHVY